LGATLSPNCNNIELNEGQIESLVDFVGSTNAIISYWSTECESKGKQGKIESVTMTLKGSGIKGAK